MIPSLPLAAALLDQYAMLTAAALGKQQHAPQRFDTAAAAIAAVQQQQETLALEALWPSILYGRLLAANSTTTSLTPPTPPASAQKPPRKCRGFSVKELLDVDDNNETPEPLSSIAANNPPPHSPSSPKAKILSSSETATISPTVTTTSTPSAASINATSPSNSKWLANSHGPLEELCKLASRPIIEENSSSPHPSTPHFLVSHMMLPAAAASSSISRAIGEFGSCPNLDQASSSNFAALLHQQQRFRQAAAVAAAASVVGTGSSSNIAGNDHATSHNRHHRFHHQNKPTTSASLGNVAIHSLNLVRRKRKTRTSFTPHQIAELEKRFFKQKYLTSSDRDDLASTLNLTAGQVITWFQNRRAKLKRDIEEIKSDIKMEGVNNNSCGSLSSASPQSQEEHFAEEDESLLDGDDDQGAINDFSLKALHAVSEPSIHKLVSNPFIIKKP